MAPVRIVLHDRRHHFRDGVACECLPAGQHLEEHDAERPDVGALVHGLAARLLGRHVGRGTENQTEVCGVRGERGGVRDVRRRSRARRIHGLGKTEVEHFHRAVRPDLDVRRFQIAVDDAALVRGFERVGDLPRDGQHFGHRQRTARDDGRQIFTIDQFHDEAAVDDAVDVGDVRVIQRGQRLCLAREAGEALRIECEEVGKDLDRDVAIELGIAGAIHLAHSAGADGGDDVVRPQLRTVAQHPATRVGSRLSCV